MRNRHHLWYTRKQYTSGISKKFRGLPCNIILIDAEIHKLLHAHQRPPSKPSAKEMTLFVERHNAGLCSCRP